MNGKLMSPERTKAYEQQACDRIGRNDELKTKPKPLNIVRDNGATIMLHSISAATEYLNCSRSTLLKALHGDGYIESLNVTVRYT